MKTKKSKNYLRKTVIGLFISGTVLMVIATSLFSFKIPQLDSDIYQKERAMENFWKNSSMHVNADINAYMAKTANGIVSLLPSSDLQKRTMDITAEDWINIKTIQMLLTYDKNDKPSSLEIKNWRKLPINQFDEMVAERLDKYTAEHNSTAVMEYNRLNKTKKTIVFWSILFQVIGILLNQSAIILQLILQKE